MDTFLKAVAAVLVTAVLCLVLNKNSRDISALVTILVCCMVAGLAIGFLEPVIAFLEQLEQTAGLDSDMLKTIMKVAGITLIAELAAMICGDAGNASLGKALQILAAVIVLWLSLPLLQSLLRLIHEILGEV